MKKSLQLITLFTLFWGTAVSQGHLFMNPIKYTDRKMAVYQSDCGSSSTIHLTINGTPISPSNTLFITGGYWGFEIEFGQMKPGDIFRVTDDCGGIPFQQVVKDDFVYVEVPSGTGHSGNSIGPNDEYAPYTKLSTPVQIGKCAPLTIDSHGLVNYFVFSPQTGGKFSINGSALTNGATPINPGGYDINFNGFQGTPVYTINPNGSITSNAPVKMESNTHYSGQIPIVVEYEHDGVAPTGDLAFGFKAMSFHHIGNSGGNIEKGSLGGAIVPTSYAGTSTSKYKITYDGVYYRAYIDNVQVDELRRFVEYNASSGTLTPGSAAGLDYSTPVTWSNMTAGNQWVSVLIDGVLYTRQSFSVADDPQINAVVLDVACAGGSSGQITVGTTGGLAPLQYALNSGPYQSSNTFTGLATGSYTVKVRDASGCTASDVVTIGTPSPMALNVTAKTDVTCSGTANGSVAIQATGGSGSYTYSKDGIYFFSPATFSSLSPGPYVFTAKDANGCMASVNDTIKTTSTIIASILSAQNVSCSGGTNGGFTISTTGSVFNGAPQFSSDNGVTFQSSAIFTGLPASTYNVVVKDNACSTNITATISQPGPLEVTAFMSAAVSCNGLSDGVINASGQAGVAPYEFSINGTQYGSGNSLSGLAAGNYKVWIRDANGCIKESAITAVSQPAVLTLSVFSKTDVTCYNGNNGQVILSVLGGTSPHSYSRDNVSYQSSSTFSSLAAGQMTLTVKDQNGCKATTGSEILQPTDILVTPTVTSTVTCYGGTNGAIAVTSSGGTGIIQHAIDGTTFLASSSFTTLPAGSYQVTAKDVRGCTKVSATIVMTQASQIVPVALTANVKCAGGQDGTVTISATGGTGTYNFSKDGTNYQSGDLFAGLSVGAYTFSVKDGSGCVKTVDVNISQPTALLATAAIQQHVLCFGGTSGILNATPNGGTSPYQYSVDGTAYQSSPIFSNLPVGTYKIWIKDQNSCITESNSNTLTQPTDLLAGITNQTAVKCNGGNDGSAELGAQGGSAPYMYSKDAVNFQPTPIFSGLSATSITFVVKDKVSCLLSL